MWMLAFLIVNESEVKVWFLMMRVFVLLIVSGGEAMVENLLTWCCELYCELYF